MIDRLKELRSQKNMSQKQLSESSEISVKAIQAYEQGYRSLGGASADVVYKLAKALETTMEYLLGY